jgi:nicotinate phosphoribosyltransferase
MLAPAISTLGLYRGSLALLVDLYELTMAYGYWKSGRRDLEAVFHLFFRHNPFDGGYAVAAGLGSVVDLLDSFEYAPADLEYLEGLEGTTGRPLFEPAFLDYLAKLKFSCDVDAVPEGTVVFAREPLVRVSGPILQAQLIESALLNLVNFQTLIASKAARICRAAKGDPVIEFGLRRAQGIDGAAMATRASFVGGCSATSNVLAAQLFGLPARGTHAHSWVMAFESEIEAFRAYADAMPDDCILLVDTYGTREGVENAILVAKELQARGHRFLGVRLDSGDLAELSIVARKMLDSAGLKEAKIIASNELDEHVIESLKQQGAKIDSWGVGTKLVTAYDDPALGGVYKLGATRRRGGKWERKIKLSDHALKATIPGLHQVRRFSKPDGKFAADAIYDIELGRDPSKPLADPRDPTLLFRTPRGHMEEDLLVPVMRSGKKVYDVPSLAQTQAFAREQLGRLDERHKRHMNPHIYRVGLDGRLNEAWAKLKLAAAEHELSQD